MSSNQQDDRKPAPRVTEDGPDFRRMEMQTRATNTIRPSSVASGQPSGEMMDRNAGKLGVIDKSSFFASRDRASTVDELPASLPPVDNSQWCPKALRPVPAFYPLEKSSRLIVDDLNMIAARLSDCMRILSVQAFYDDETATASLLTAEHVEMHLSLWGSPKGVVVELQRRKGDSITFHRYSRYILDAAIGDFEPETFSHIEAGYTKKVQRMLKTRDRTGTEEENAIIALEMAHGLLKKDRMDARQLGLESLCLLTDPSKTGFTTAWMASNCVLLGTTAHEDLDEVAGPLSEIRETIISLVQFKRIGEEDEILDALADEDDGHDLQEIDHMHVLHNLALAVLANALEVIEGEEQFEEEPEMTRSMRNRLGSEDVANAFLKDANSLFGQSKELLSTLISELGVAGNTPHNACLSAKCLRSLLGASQDARRRSKELGAKQVVSTALEVGTRTHARLETECIKVQKAMTATEEEEQQQQQQEEEDGDGGD
mmetsp:Transcript_1708/g.2309  ORF Transcript_1708/g.2309 Transcript_1708/m.2309 type:complete len:487 (-) Transcript_1708:60-1520(-)|eukprot:CAMPEP_0194031596 /NCGR_PEP_ID=MMETSP0009_2-20130614/4739_1 /TAXON_ID=210454 /ORGANISM="Grammatophora oceanica, Strain CCMP 410" /LENGTH=486 /DNA_ID=CAMNT_0038671801 /DNA_START=100 /DNA_END=1560 /DNA_ORIENTATION=-